MGYNIKCVHKAGYGLVMTKSCVQKLNIDSPYEMSVCLFSEGKLLLGKPHPAAAVIPTRIVR